MSQNALAKVRKVLVDSEVIEETLEVLQAFGAHRVEGLVLWLGTIDTDSAKVLKVVLPDQKAIREEDGMGYFVDSATLFQLNQSLAESGLRLIAQVHSHPREAFHSDTDDQYAIVTADGGLSLVVPHFGQAEPDPACWAVYRLRDGFWTELDAMEIRNLIRVGEAE